MSMESLVKAAIMKRKVGIFNTFGYPKINYFVYSRFNIIPCDFICVAPKLPFFCEKTHIDYLNVVFAGAAYMEYQVQMAHSSGAQKEI